MKYNNPVWDFFASVRLAIFTLCSLALTSVIGTIIPQNKPGNWYADEYGATAAQFIQILDIHDMYGSWWFLLLLGLLCANLIICSVDRFPVAWRLITADQLAVTPDRIRKMGFHDSWSSPSSPQLSADTISSELKKAGWQPASRQAGDAVLLFAGKGAWSRLGVYVVHLSILIIFGGAVIGNLFGFKGTIMLPEKESTGKIFAFGTSEPIDLGFEVECDAFAVDYYPNGMPKEYKSVLIVREKDKEVRREEIEVNKPMTHRGITFYQSSYQAYQDFIVSIVIGPEKTGKVFTIPYQREMEWPDKQIRFGIVNAEGSGDRVTRVKFWLQDGAHPASTFWIENNQPKMVSSPERALTLSVKQMYATGLQVAKDPGVWLVYLGCSLMLIGLYMAFFVSHQRIWVLLEPTGDDSGTIIQLAGASNKNAAGFGRTFAALAERLRCR
jgi:cytochrome c biogenesis protein